MKCSKCNKKIEKTFLNKIKGTIVKGKAICSLCQKSEISEKAL
jgi:hypothetical protein